MPSLGDPHRPGTFALLGSFRTIPAAGWPEGLMPAVSDAGSLRVIAVMTPVGQPQHHAFVIAGGVAPALPAEGLQLAAQTNASRCALRLIASLPEGVRAEYRVARDWSHALALSRDTSPEHTVVWDAPERLRDRLLIRRAGLRWLDRRTKAKVQ